MHAHGPHQLRSQLKATLDGQENHGMKLSINYELRDEDVVRGITSFCDKLGLEYSLEERNDWLMHGLHPASEDSTPMLLVISPHTTTSWWLPFQLGRAADRGMGILPYVTESASRLPSYLETGRLVCGHQELLSRLCRLTKFCS